MQHHNHFDSSQPDNLRFSKGDPVLFHTPNGWYPARITSLWYREHKWSPSRPSAPYQIKLDQTGEICIATYDNDSHVRVVPEDLTPNLNMCVLDQEPFDPNAAEYLEPNEAACMDKSEQEALRHNLSRQPGVESVRANPDGSHSVTHNAGSSRRTTTMQVERLPQTTSFGVDPMIMTRLAQSIQTRRSYNDTQDGESPDFQTIFQSAVPSERSLRELERKSREDPVKMLQLADALMSGVHGWRRDPNRACKCYYAAAWGCREDEVDSRMAATSKPGVPIGTGEACSAVAYVNISGLAANFGEQLNPLSVSRSVLRRFHKDRVLKDHVEQFLFWLCYAVRKGCVSPMALHFASAIKEERMVKKLSPDVLPLMAALEYREKEMQIQELTEHGLLGRGDASDVTIERFARRAVDIFHRLPMQAKAPSGFGPSDIHIEFREMPIEPFPIVVFAVIPFARFVVKAQRLPLHLQVCPFSSEAFRYIWLRLAFELHLGAQGAEHLRYRPAVFTVMNKPGDRELGEYLREVIQPEICGTQVRFVDYDHQVPGIDNSPPARLGHIMHELESNFVAKIGEFMHWKEGEHIRSPVEHMRSYFSTRTEVVSIEAVLPEASNLKEEGNAFYLRNRYIPALKCYSEAVAMLRTIVKPDKRVFQLLGTLLSNRAVCMLKLIEGASNESKLHILKEVIQDCSVVLNSEWKQWLASPVLAKVVERKKTALEKRAHLRSLDASIKFDEHSPLVGKPAVSEVMGLFGSRLFIDAHLDEQVDCSIYFGNQLVEMGCARNATKGDDPCPSCIDRFGFELAQKYTTVLKCGHAFCVHCLAKFQKMVDSPSQGSEGSTFCCFMCRTPINGLMIDALAKKMSEEVVCLRDLGSQLPFTPAENSQVVRLILSQRLLDVEEAEKHIGRMLIEGARSHLCLTEDLSPEDKQLIRNEAREREEALSSKLQELVTRCNGFRDEESEEYKLCFQEKVETHQQLLKAQQVAAAEIFHVLNTIGSMGKVWESGRLYIDFHGLGVKEAKQRFDEYVKPLLPALEGGAVLVTGRGAHSKGGFGVLKEQLKNHLKKEEQVIEWSIDPKNSGVINVRWIG